MLRPAELDSGLVGLADGVPHLPERLTRVPPLPHTRVQPFGFPIDRAYIWGAVGYLWGLLLVLSAMSAVVLRYAQAPSPQPTGELVCGAVVGALDQQHLTRSLGQAVASNQLLICMPHSRCLQCRKRRAARRCPAACWPRCSASCAARWYSR